MVPTVPWQLRLEKVCESELERSRGWGGTRSCWVGWEEVVPRTGHKLVTEVCLKAVGRGGDEVWSLQVWER